MHADQTTTPNPMPPTPTRSTRVAWVASPADLACFYDDDVIAVVWRGAVTALDDACAALPSPSGRLVLDAHSSALRCLGHGSLLSVIEVFASLADTPEVGVRWRTAQAPMCPQFHVDRVELRACLTLRGPGTELHIEDEIVRTRAGDLVVMKGTLLDPLHDGCRHRSPPQDEGADRVVLTLDIVTSPPGSKAHQ